MPATATDRIDGLTTSVAVKAPVRVATTGPITASGLQTVDGTLLAPDDRVLRKDEVNTVNNGIFVVASTAWYRAKDFDGARDVVQGTLIPIYEGTINGRTIYQCTTVNPIYPGTSNLTFEIIEDIDIAADLASSTDGLGASLVFGVARVVNSISALKALSKIFNSRALVTGYYAAGDGGGGIYWYDSTDTTSADNGGTIIVASDSGRWKLQQISPPTVKQFGAKGDGTTNDTAAIQAALTALLHVIVPDGTYKLTSSLTGRPNQSIIGTTPERCQFQRSTVYGNTLLIGTNASSSTHAGAVTVKGIWFNHQYAFNNGSTYIAGTSTSITNKDPTATHLKIVIGQNVRIEDCWFYGIGYGVQMTDTAQAWVDRCIFNGLWDLSLAAMQDTTASVWLNASSSSDRCGLITFKNCYLNGYSASAAGNVTTGSVTVSKTLNNGPRYGLWVQSCERLVFSDGYIGGQSDHCVYLNPNAILGHVHIHDNMIDGASNYSIAVYSLSASFPVSYLKIHDNTGVGYGNDKGFVFLQENGTNPPVVRGDIQNNNIQYYLQAPIRIERSKGIKIDGNTVAAYNSDHSVTSDPYVMAGCVLDGNTTDCSSSNNTWGGGINDPTSTNYAKWGIYYSVTTRNYAALERAAAAFGIAGGTVVGLVTPDYPT